MRKIFTAISCVVAAAQPSLADDRAASLSVVQIRCALAEGEMKATGFVWPERGQVVTALHAVAGCEEVLVWSEATRRETVATEITNVDLEADLALITLEDDLGVEPVSFAAEPPDTRALHYAWGYPHAAEQMIDLRVEFAGGLAGGTTTLGQAFASTELDSLFRDQEYPTRETQILRVTTTIQPGQSGAPIFDDAGGVVAIADGGLLGGWRGINWSIPAHVYLPGLPSSDDPLPASASAWSGLYAAVTAAETTSVRLAPHDLDDGAELPPELRLVRRISLDAVEQMVIEDEDQGWLETIDEIREIAGDDLSHFSFDIYEDQASGATVAVPSSMALVWNESLGAAEAMNASGAARMTIAVSRAASFDEALDVDVEDFVAKIDGWADWYDFAPADFDYDVFDEADEFAEFAGLHEGEDRETGAFADMLLLLTISGRDFLGSSVYLVGEDEDLGDQDILDDRLMQIAAEYLTDFALK